MKINSTIIDTVFNSLSFNVQFNHISKIQFCFLLQLVGNESFSGTVVFFFFIYFYIYIFYIFANSKQIKKNIRININNRTKQYSDGSL